MKHIIVHWRTSIGGLIMAILLALQPLTVGGEPFDFQKDWLRYLFVILIAIGGFIMKDPSKKSDTEDGL